MRLKGILIIVFVLFALGCTKEESTETTGLLGEGGSEIMGQWFLVAIGDVDVSAIECYRDSFLEASRSQLTFFIQDREEDGSCTTVLSETLAYEEQEGFYYIEDEAIEIYIEGNLLTWRVDFETTLVFEKD